MTPEDLRTALRTQPFVPFRLHLSDGRSFDVPHPEFLLVAESMAVVGVYQASKNNGQLAPQRTEMLSLLHIVSLEPLTQTA